MTDPHDNKPRPYSRYNPVTQRVEWVAPVERGVSAPKRSRLENDDEVRKRLQVHFGSGWGRAVHGATLDEWLKSCQEPPRHYVDDIT